MPVQLAVWSDQISWNPPLVTPPLCSILCWGVSIIVAIFECNFFKVSSRLSTCSFSDPSTIQQSSHRILCLWRVYWYWTIDCDAVLQFLVMDIIFKMLLGILCHLIEGLPVILSVFRDCFGACPFRCHGAFLFFFGIPRSLFSWGFSIAVGCGCGVALDGSWSIWGWLLFRVG